MASLPAAIPLQAPRGPRRDPSQPLPTDFGLEHLGADLAQAAEKKRQVDDHIDAAEGAKVVQTIRDEFEPQQAEREQQFDFNQSGYAKMELANLEAVAKKHLDAAPSVGVREAASRALDAYKASAGGSLIALEANKRAEPLRQQRIAAEALDQSNAAASYMQAFGKAQSERRAGADKSMAGWMAGSLEDHDAAAQAVLDAQADPGKKARLAIYFAAERQRVAAQASDVEQKGQLADIADKFSTGLAGLRNGVLSNPGGYDAAVAKIPDMAAAIPGPARDGVEREALGHLAGARIEGLIETDNIDQAKAELNDGRYDKVLKPEEKQRLLTRADAAAQRGPKTFGEWQAQLDLEDRVKAEIIARSTTGRGTGLSLDEITKSMGPHAAAEAARQLEQADKTFAAIGDVRDKTMDQLHGLAAADPPDPADPDYVDKLKAYQLGAKAAASELKARHDDPAGWAQKPATPGDWQGQNADRWQAFIAAAPGEPRIQAGRAYASNVLGIQERVGVGPAQQRIFSKDEAATLAKQYLAAAPEQKAAALGALVGVVHGLPSEMNFPSGRRAAPQAMAVRELQAAGLSATDAGAIADLGDNKGQMQAYIHAVSNPEAKKKLPEKGAEANLESAVDSALRPFIASSNALPGSAQANAARRDRAILIARDQITGGQKQAAAVEAATADLVGAFQFVDGYRVPRTVAPDADGRAEIRRGAATVLGSLISGGQGNRGFNGVVPNLLAPLPGVDGRPLPPDEGARKAAQAIHDNGRWVTTEDDAGLMLMVPTADKGWRPVQDKFGRAINLSWSQLQAAGKGKPQAWFSTPSSAPPPGEPGAAPAADKPAKVAKAMAQSVEIQESGGRSGLTSDQGALGVMQMLPDTARRAAARMGVAFDQNRLLNDAAYNRRLGQNELSFLSQRYGGNVALVAAAYHAGPANVDAWIDRYGDPRRGVNVDQWVARLSASAPKTASYVRAVLPRAMNLLK